MITLQRWNGLMFLLLFLQQLHINHSFSLLHASCTIQRRTIRRTISLSSHHPSSSSDSNDSQVHEWYDKLGIVAPKLQLQTTSKSIGGRGVFFVPSSGSTASSTNCIANVGDLLAYIPIDAILGGRSTTTTPNIPKSTAHSSNDGTNNDSNKQYHQLIQDHSQLEWPMKLVAHAVLHEHQDRLLSTLGLMNVPNYATKSGHEYSHEELQSLADLAKTNDIDMIQEALQRRHDDFCCQLEILLDIPGLKERINQIASSRTVTTAAATAADGNDNDDAQDVITKQWLASIHCCILSRAIALSHLQQYCLVPLQDMINHLNEFHKINVGLYSIDTIRKMTNASSLEAQLERQLQMDCSSENSINDDDVCLVAIRPIQHGTELFNSYTGWTEEQPPERRIWKLLQYGFPLA